jgi:hypothetical protein
MEHRCPQCQVLDPWGVEVRGAYDGVLYWECSACHHMWPRFSDGRLHEQGVQAIGLRMVAQVVD